MISWVTLRFQLAVRKLRLSRARWSQFHVWVHQMWSPQLKLSTGTLCLGCCLVSRTFLVRTLGKGYFPFCPFSAVAGLSNCEEESEVSHYKPPLNPGALELLSRKTQLEHECQDKLGRQSVPQLVLSEVQNAFL